MTLVCLKEAGSPTLGQCIVPLAIQWLPKERGLYADEKSYRIFKVNGRATIIRDISHQDRLNSGTGNISSGIYYYQSISTSRAKSQKLSVIR